MSVDAMQNAISDAPDANLAWLADTCPRLVLTHRIDLAPSREHWGSPVQPSNPTPSLPECLALLVNILVRLEVRLRGDTRLLLQTLATPLPALDGRTLAKTSTDIDCPGVVRDSIAAIPVPEIRMWRCASRYA